MSKFEVLILPIDRVEKHPNADRLSINFIRGYCAVSNKVDTDPNNGEGKPTERFQHRYSPGQLVAYVPLGAKIPASLLLANGYWDTFKDRGFLGGPNYDVVSPINLRSVLSRGLIFPLKENLLVNGDGHKRLVHEGDDVTKFLGITKEQVYYPNIEHDSGSLVEQFSIEDLQKYPTMLDGHQVIITELLHGIGCAIRYDRTQESPFLVMDSCGRRVLGQSIYTELAVPVWEDIKRYLEKMPAVERLYIFGTIIGPGIQDITYGLNKPEFRAHDVLMGLMGAGRDSIPFGYIGVRKYELFKWLSISAVPILWGGKYDSAANDQLTDGPSSIGGGLRKGVVITSEDENKTNGIRPILKNISDKYLLRSKGTEYK